VVIDGSGDEPRRIAVRAGHRSYARYVEAVPREFSDVAATRTFEAAR
jgi:hypothetical protein